MIMLQHSTAYSLRKPPMNTAGTTNNIKPSRHPKTHEPPYSTAAWTQRFAAQRRDNAANGLGCHARNYPGSRNLLPVGNALTALRSYRRQLRTSLGVPKTCGTVQRSLPMGWKVVLFDTDFALFSSLNAALRTLSQTLPKRV